MRRVTVVSLLVVLVTLWGGAAFAQEPGRITVTGEAEVLVPPDEVVLTLGVETSDKDLSAAKRENDLRVQSVMATARAAGVEERHIQTEFIHIAPRWENEYEHRRFLGYFVQKTIVITLKDITRFEDLLTAAVSEKQANYVHGIEFRTTELRKHRDQARSLAIRAAREKAEALAGELGFTIARPVNINEDHLDWWSSYDSWWGQSSAGLMQNVVQNIGGAVKTGEGVAVGQVSVQARVTVSFELGSGS